MDSTALSFMALEERFSGMSFRRMAPEVMASSLSTARREACACITFLATTKNKGEKQATKIQHAYQMLHTKARRCGLLYGNKSRYESFDNQCLPTRVNVPGPDAPIIA